MVSRGISRRFLGAFLDVSRASLGQRLGNFYGKLYGNCRGKFTAKSRQFTASHGNAMEAGGPPRGQGGVRSADGGVRVADRGLPTSWSHSEPLDPPWTPSGPPPGSSSGKMSGFCGKTVAPPRGSKPGRNGGQNRVKKARFGGLDRRETASETRGWLSRSKKWIDLWVELICDTAKQGLTRCAVDPTRHFCGLSADDDARGASVSR